MESSGEESVLFPESSTSLPANFFSPLTESRLAFEKVDSKEGEDLKKEKLKKLLSLSDRENKSTSVDELASVWFKTTIN